MYYKSTMFALADGKLIHRSGHTKKVASVPRGTYKINYYVSDLSGKGRNGASSLAFTDQVTDQDLRAAATKA